VNASNKIITLVKRMNATLSFSDIPLTVVAGQEYHYGADFRKDFATGDLQTLGNSNCLPVELPSQETPKNPKLYLQFLRGKGIAPVIAHPERHLPFIREPERLYEFIAAGAICQLTAPSLVGHFGVEVQQVALLMARNQWIHLLASDAHDVTKRGFRLQEAFWLLDREGAYRQTKA
jgi:protein-tyrosine phosphatase